MKAKRLNLSFSLEEFALIEKAAKTEAPYLPVGTAIKQMLLRVVTSCNELLLPLAPPGHARTRGGINSSLPLNSSSSLSEADLKSKSCAKPLANLEVTELIIAHLNQVAGTRYRAKANKTRTLIARRLAEGFEPADFIRAIDNKWADWQGTEYEKYMRPETLFGPKFDGYQGTNEQAAKKRQDDTRGLNPDAAARRRRNQQRAEDVERARVARENEAPEICDEHGKPIDWDAVPF